MDQLQIQAEQANQAQIEKIATALPTTAKRPLQFLPNLQQHIILQLVPQETRRRAVQHPKPGDQQPQHHQPSKLIVHLQGDTLSREGAEVARATCTSEPQAKMIHIYCCTVMYSR